MNTKVHHYFTLQPKWKKELEITKTTRLEKIISLILNGVGLNDKYRN